MPTILYLHPSLREGGDGKNSGTNVRAKAGYGERMSECTGRAHGLKV